VYGMEGELLSRPSSRSIRNEEQQPELRLEGPLRRGKSQVRKQRENEIPEGKQEQTTAHSEDSKLRSGEKTREWAEARREGRPRRQQSNQKRVFKVKRSGVATEKIAAQLSNISDKAVGDKIAYQDKVNELKEELKETKTKLSDKEAKKEEFLERNNLSAALWTSCFDNITPWRIELKAKTLNRGLICSALAAGAAMDSIIATLRYFTCGMGSFGNSPAFNGGILGKLFALVKYVSKCTMFTGVAATLCSLGLFVPLLRKFLMKTVVVEEAYVDERKDAEEATDQRADSISLGELKHLDPQLATVVHNVYDYSHWTSIVLGPTVNTRKSIISFEMLSQCVTSSGLSLLSDDAVTLERMNTTLSNLHSVNVNRRLSAYYNDHIVPNTTVIAHLMSRIYKNDVATILPNGFLPQSKVLHTCMDTGLEKLCYRSFQIFSLVQLSSLILRRLIHRSLNARRYPDHLDVIWLGLHCPELTLVTPLQLSLAPTRGLGMPRLLRRLTLWHHTAILYAISFLISFQRHLQPILMYHLSSG